MGNLILMKYILPNLSSKSKLGNNYGRIFLNIYESKTNDASLNDNNITIEYQRKRAKYLIKSFSLIQRDKQIQDDKIFGWTSKNEIINGRWVMIGLLIGFLTEYATGVNFVDQIKITISYLGIADLGD